MQPGEAQDGRKDQGNPPAIGHLGRDRDPPAHSSPPHPSPERSTEEQQNLEREDEQKNLENGDEQPQQPVASLPEDALVEILSRVPYRSLRRFKCVSKPWLALCSATDIRRRSPQTLSGFFHFSIDGLKFHNLSGRGLPMVDPSLPFLHRRYKRIMVEQCCRSLLLCQCWKSSSSEGDEYDYVVCNPATEKLIVLPPLVSPDQEDGHLFNLDPSNIFLGFDTAAPSRFVVFAPLSRYCDEFAEVAIYSSDTGQWTFVKSQWGKQSTLVGNPQSVFLNGIMHLTTHHSSVATVDAEGKIWRKIEIPGIMPNRYDNAIASIGQSQGCLHAWRIDYHHDCQLSVWVLEDYDNGKWTLKHTVNVLELFRRHWRRDIESYTMFAIHPECNVIFLTDGEEMTVSYDMDNQKVHVICTSEEFLGGLPYTPCFAE